MPSRLSICTSWQDGPILIEPELSPELPIFHTTCTHSGSSIWLKATPRQRQHIHNINKAGIIVFSSLLTQENDLCHQLQFATNVAKHITTARLPTIPFIELYELYGLLVRDSYYQPCHRPSPMLCPDFEGSIVTPRYQSWDVLTPQGHISINDITRKDLRRPYSPCRTNGTHLGFDLFQTDHWTLFHKRRENCPNKYVDLMYRIIHAALALRYQTGHYFQNKAFNCAHGCPEKETYLHLFWDCPQAQFVWDTYLPLFERLGFEIPTQTDVFQETSLTGTNPAKDSLPQVNNLWFRVNTHILFAIWKLQKQKTLCAWLDRTTHHFVLLFMRVWLSKAPFWTQSSKTTPISRPNKQTGGFLRWKRIHGLANMSLFLALPSAKRNRALPHLHQMRMMEMTIILPIERFLRRATPGQFFARMLLFKGALLLMLLNNGSDDSISRLHTSIEQVPRPPPKPIIASNA